MKLKTVVWHTVKFMESLNKDRHNKHCDIAKHNHISIYATTVIIV